MRPTLHSMVCLRQIFGSTLPSRRHSCFPGIERTQIPRVSSLLSLWSWACHQERHQVLWNIHQEQRPGRNPFCTAVYTLLPPWSPSKHHPKIDSKSSKNHLRSIQNRTKIGRKIGPALNMAQKAPFLPQVESNNGPKTVHVGAMLAKNRIKNASQK